MHSEGRVATSMPAEEGLPNQRRCLYASNLSPFTRSTSGLIKSWYKWDIWGTQTNPRVYLPAKFSSSRWGPARQNNKAPGYKNWARPKKRQLDGQGSPLPSLSKAPAVIGAGTDNPDGKSAGFSSMPERIHRLHYEIQQMYA